MTNALKSKAEAAGLTVEMLLIRLVTGDAFAKLAGAPALQPSKKPSEADAGYSHTRQGSRKMSNPATRILTLVYMFQAVPAKSTVSDGWGQVLDLEGDKHQYLTIKAMGALIDELNLTQARLDELGAGNELFGRTATRVLEIFGPTSLALPLHNMREVLHSELLTLGLSWPVGHCKNLMNLTLTLTQ